MRTCKVCNEEKLEEAFYYWSQSHRICLDCAKKAKNAKHAEKHPPKPSDLPPPGTCKVCLQPKPSEAFIYWGHRHRTCHECMLKQENEAYAEKHPPKPEEIERTCKECGVTRPKADFFYAQIWSYTCIDCRKKYYTQKATEWRAENHERALGIQRDHNDRESTKASKRKWERANRRKRCEQRAMSLHKLAQQDPEKYEIRKIARAMAGLFVKLGPCMVCGEEKGTQRHHIDYKNGPTEVYIFCQPCHLLVGHNGNWRNSPGFYVNGINVLIQTPSSKGDVAEGNNKSQTSTLFGGDQNSVIP